MQCDYSKLVDIFPKDSNEDNKIYEFDGKD